jgi:CRP-like cAMP-binding protein
MAVDYHMLRDAELFNNLDDAVLHELAQRCTMMELPAGETLFQQGENSGAFYLLRRGQVHIIRQYPDGEQVILGTEGPYYVIGALPMLVDQLHTGTVVAVSDCTLIVLRRTDFVDACQAFPSVSMQIMHYLGLRLYRMNLKVREHAIGNVAARVASVLVLLADGNNGPLRQHVRVSRVARAAATDADVVERLFAQWSEAGYMTFDMGQITIHKLDVLRAIAG